jgi:hypothetical protein
LNKELSQATHSKYDKRKNSSKQQLRNTPEQKKITTAVSYVGGGITVAWHVTPYCLEERYQHFRGINCLNLQGATLSHAGEGGYSKK